MTLSLDSLLWKLWLAGMAVLVLLSGAGMQRVSTEGGICLTHIFVLEGKKKCDLFSFAAACSQFSVYINSCGKSNS